jgi:16S rRNA (uracil1498-N3)-methyltransferase
MQEGEQLLLTDGKGNKASATIIDSDKHQCSVRVDEVMTTTAAKQSITLAVSLLKHPDRFEWLLEKVTEIGVTKIIPLLCARTEKQQFKKERCRNILISALLQSKQCFLPELTEPKNISEFIKESTAINKWIAHCEDDETKRKPFAAATGETVMLIGPEGDFTAAEIQFALSSGFLPVSLGDTRLRTETAAMVAAVMLRANVPGVTKAS